MDFDSRLDSDARPRSLPSAIPDRSGFFVLAIAFVAVTASAACSSKTPGSDDSEFGDKDGGSDAAGNAGSGGSAGSGGTAGTAGAGDGGAGGSCSPATVGTYTPPTLKPIVGWKTGACTTAQIGDFVTACLLNNDANCKTFMDAAANKTCMACIETPESAAAYGAFVSTSGGVFDNTYGCMEHYKAGCGSSAATADKCGELACATACTGKNDDAVKACLEIAGKGTCKNYVDTANANCSQTFRGDPPPEAQVTCFGTQADTADTFYKRYIAAFCGPT
ncbi:MAG: hypothetical protein U0169_03315 [Polyangiaceae bacterium]